MYTFVVVGHSWIWLTHFLLSAGGRAPVTMIEEAASSAGISRSTLFRVRKELKIESVDVSVGKGNNWRWKEWVMPDEKAS